MPVLAYSAFSAIVIVGLAAWLGHMLGREKTGILIDDRGRYSLNRFQMVLWTVVGLSAISGLFLARLFAGLPDPLEFAVPAELLAAMGISFGGGALAAAAKAGKDAANPAAVAASDAAHPPRFSQVFLAEEGSLADQIVDVSKFQSFLITLILGLAYVALLAKRCLMAASVEAVLLPGFEEQFLVLLGISHAGYLTGKLPSHPQATASFSVTERNAALAIAKAAKAPTVPHKN